MSIGHLFVISAPSGTGKTTLIRRLLEDDLGGFGGVAFSVSHTSRPPRRGEVDGRDYHFIDRARFEAMIRDESFMEWADVYGEYKGTARQEVEPRLAQGLDVILDIDVQGADRILGEYPAATGVFIVPPSRKEMERRLRARGLDEPRQIERRLSVSRWEIERYDNYEYVIINDDLERAYRALTAIILERRHRRALIDSRVQALLEEFEEN